jgi:hypothetical protein
MDAPNKEFVLAGNLAELKLQTADIARRLMRGGELHQEAGAS